MHLPKPFVVAEISANHGGDYETAFLLVNAAKRAGADAVKFQLYTADEMTIESDRDEFKIKDGLWKGRTLYDLYSEGSTPKSWFPRLFKHARDLGLIPFSSVFSKAGVDYLETLDCPIYKIASFEITDIPLIEHAHATGKHLIISTGVADFDDEARVYRFEPYLLYCISDYPATDVQLPDFNSEGMDGLSDHSLSLNLPALAVARGATIIEKHITLDRAGGTLDAQFSLDPDEFAEMVSRVREAWDAINGPSPSESPYASLKRSLCAVEDIKKGELFTEQNIRSIRPGDGMHPKFLHELLGKPAPTDYERGQPL